MTNLNDHTSLWSTGKWASFLQLLFCWSSLCILKCNMMVAAFMGIKISLWCIKVYVITSAALKWECIKQMWILLLFGIIKQFKCPFWLSNENLYYMYTNLVLNSWLFKHRIDCVVKCVITVQNSYMKLASGNEDWISGSWGRWDRSCWYHSAMVLPLTQSLRTDGSD